jgi:pyruvate/2-oxoglutarate/acetoin dehydrogenase E1 component
MQPEVMEVEVTTSDPADTDVILDPIRRRWIIVEELWLGLFNTNEELAAAYAESFIEQLKKASSCRKKFVNLQP